MAPQLSIPLVLGLGTFFGGLYWGITFAFGDSTIYFLPACLIAGALGSLAARNVRSGARFSVRAMFVLTALLAIWFGLQVIAVRERKAAFNYIDAMGADFEVGGASDHWVRRMLGDLEVTCVVIGRENASPELEALIRRRFPEAQLSYR